MKKIKMGLMALAGIIGIGGAFAFKPAKVAGALIMVIVSIQRQLVGQLRRQT
jgi:hypothetical protein